MILGMLARQSMLIATAIKFLHMNGCVHRRVRENSFMMTEEGVVKLVEFGFSCAPPPDTDARLLLFRPPEYGLPVALSAELQSKADVWSLGVLLVIMATGGAPSHHIALDVVPYCRLVMSSCGIVPWCCLVALSRGVFL